jgi:ribosomal protein L40E
MKIMSALAVEYPNFPEIIKGETARAQEVMKSADAITSEEDKINKMAEANGILYGTYARNIYDIKSTRDTLKKKVEEAKPLICKYCGTSNPPTATSCKSCGAALK